PVLHPFPATRAHGRASCTRPNLRHRPLREDDWTNGGASCPHPQTRPETPRGGTSTIGNRQTMTTEAKLLKFQVPAARREAVSLASPSEAQSEAQSEARIAALLAAFCAHPRFILTSHARPDGDAIGSALALAEVLDQLGCKVDIILADPIPSTYRALPNLHR